jgi:curved DNA-binding protein CbpA
MSPRAPDPYATLGVSAGASDAELRTAYRRLVQLHHPDHNGGSAESARRFEEVQEAYARVRELRRRGDAAGAPRAHSTTPPSGDPGVESRLEQMERELRAARAARERAQREAREAARQAAQADGRNRPSDEELGYITTDDSLSKILSDAASGISARLSDHLADARIEHIRDATRPEAVANRMADLLDELGSRLGGEHRKQ